MARGGLWTDVLMLLAHGIHLSHLLHCHVRVVVPAGAMKLIAQKAHVLGMRARTAPGLEREHEHCKPMVNMT